MATKKEIIVDGETYIKKSDAVNYTGDIKIVILQRGWVMVGRFEKGEDTCKLYDASVIRSWGTTKGLGEIAEGGPTSTTKLDKCYGVVEFDWLTVVASVAVNDEAWKKYL